MKNAGFCSFYRIRRLGVFWEKSSKNCLEEGAQFGEPTLRIRGDVVAFAVDEAVGEQEHIHAQFPGHQVLLDIVADHQTAGGI